MNRVQYIGGYAFNKVSDTEYIVTFPDGHSEKKHYLAAESLMKREKAKLQPNSNKIKNEVFAPNSLPYLKLQATADLLNAFVEGYEFAISNCYLDANRGIPWTTILRRRKNTNDSCMMFVPSEQEELLNASYTDFTKLLSKHMTNLKK